MIDLEAIRERLEKATDGPWEWTKTTEILGEESKYGVYCPTSADDIAHECGPHNADLIAHAPADIKALVEEVERLRGGFAEYIYQTTNTSVPSTVGGREYRNAMIPYSAIKDARDLVRQESTP